MFMRRRPLLRAGMLAGTAAAAHRAGTRSAERQYAESEQDQRLAALEAQQQYAPQPVAPAAAPPAGGGTDIVAELTKLKGLADAGVLTPEEFQAAKAKLLAG
jgi:Short C-terminal domain